MRPFNPQFVASDPKSKESSMGWANQECTLQLEAAKTPEEYMKAMLAQYEELNVAAVVMGDAKEVQKWKDAAPAGRIIAGTSFDGAMRGTSFLPLEDMRAAFTKGGMQVMGEVGLEYQGMNPVALASGNRTRRDPGTAVRTYHEGLKPTLKTGTFYLAGKRNFLPGSDRRTPALPLFPGEIGYRGNRAARSR
jgi:hypothetical protein